jgi:hypothetical protein
VFIIWGACYDGCEGLSIIFHDHPVDHALKDYIKDGLLTSGEILLDSSVWHLAHKRFLEAFGKDDKNV